MHTNRSHPAHGFLPAIIAVAVAGAIVSITIARQQFDAERMAADGMARSVAAATPAPRPPSSVPAGTAAGPPVQSFSRDGDVLRIHARNVPRPQAAEQLARLTRARILAGAQWLALAPDLDLDWQGGDPAEAWKRVLGSVRHTVACGDAGCTVRILSVDVEGGSVTVPEPAQASKAGSPAETSGLMNRPTDPDAIDESSLGP